MSGKTKHPKTNSSFDALTKAIAIALTVLGTAVAVVILAMASGLFATVLAHIPDAPYNTEQAKGIINALTLILTLALAPCVLHTFFVATTKKGTVTSLFKQAFCTVKSYYLKVLACTITSMVTGLILAIVFYYLPSHIVLWIIEKIVYLIVGAIAIYRIYLLYRSKKDAPTPFGKLFREVRSKARTEQQSRYPLKQHLSLAQPARQSSRPHAHKTIRLTLALLMTLGSMPSV